MNIGQGRPGGAFTAPRRRRAPTRSPAPALRRSWRGFALLTFLLVGGALFAVLAAEEPASRSPMRRIGDAVLGAANEPAAAAVVDDEPIDLQLRLAWGGSDRAWQVAARVDDGRVVEVRGLGREPDDPGSYDLRDGQVHVLQHRPRSYSGMDLKVTGGRQSQLIVELTPRDRPTATKRLIAKFADLLQQSPTMDLDDQQNRLMVSRAPGDRLRVRFDRDHLVFAPGAEFRFEVEPHWTGFEPGTMLRLKTQLLRARSEEELWRSEVDLRVRDDGVLARPDAIAVKLPDVEGIYDVELTLAPRRLPGSLTAALSRAAVQRTIQVAVVDEQPAPPDRTAWKSLGEIDPTHGPLGEETNLKWTDWLKRLPQWKWTSGFTQGPLGNGRASRVDHHGRPLVQLAPDGWQAYPLPVQRIGEPHQLELEYPSDLMQTLAVSIVEPNAAGKVLPIGVDAGLEVQEPPAGDPSKILKYKLTFWPRTKTPLVLLANRRSDRPATFGKLSVLAGPTRLAPAPRHGRAAPAAEQRLHAAFFDRPLFPENFGARKELDSSRDGAWDDWATFLDGGRRLVEYLHHAGYNAAVVTVVCEGSALYPSRLLDPTPKYDSGTFFTNGADPVRKDVLEMLLRLFDREGLILIPAIQFAAPLPELERLKRAGEAEAAGVELIGPEGTSWATRHETNQGLAPYYNPLDPRVRRAMSAVVAELEERYSQHESFGGLALQLGPDTYLQFPGETWGIDDATTARFSSEQRVRVPGLGPMKFTQRGEYLSGDARGKWLAWRARELAATFEQLQTTLARRNPQLKLFLASADLLTSGPVQTQLRPALPSRPQPEAAFESIGIAPEHYRGERVVLLRPQRTAPRVSLAAQGVNLEASRSTALDALFAGDGPNGVHWYHEAAPFALPSFDAVSPFGAENTRTWLVTHAAPAGPSGRQRLTRSLAASDSQYVFDGGWLLPLGSEEETRGIREVFRHLPRERFETARATDASRSQPLVVRYLHAGQQTYVYVVNDSPWQVQGQVDLQASGEFRAAALGSSERPAVERTADGWRWKPRLAPYDVQAVLLTAPRVVVTGWQAQVDSQLVAQLAQRLQDIRTRANRLRAPQPYDVLRNPGFELAAKEGAPQWLHAQGPGISVQVDKAVAHGGAQSLRIKSDDGVVWLRSPPFAAPATGRLAVWAWLRAERPDSQPPLRLAIEGRLDGRTYYRFATVGGRSSSPLSAQWTQYWFQIDDLPTAGLADLRVGFDLMGAGEIWVDDVQIFDLWFYDNERDDLIKNIGLADFNLTSGRVADCQRFLDGYWPRFLKQHVPREPLLVRGPGAARPPASSGPTPASALTPAAPTLGPVGPLPPPPVAGPASPDAAAEKTSWKNRVNSLLPKKMRQ